ncbi:SepM family pheromone-processing serine protease [Lacticaseibacillus jixianensis]|uniref:SepM family pheromone-processing serine protease n=1 Tax=Lacticaseibacillus jixianensis TaxID=2486012 RepID=A0ABW4BAL8_9LACO|nr:SepM family pheromone-processing serine protease [Lacticaseibacillus jixianensis]
MKRINRPRHRWSKLVALLIGVILLGVLIFGLFTYRTNYYAEEPGIPVPAKAYVTVSGERDRQPGTFLLMTVHTRGPLTLAQALQAKMQPYTELFQQKKAEWRAEQMGNWIDAQMATASAEQAAFKLAKKPVSAQYMGLWVRSVAKNSPFHGLLQAGDTITQVDGKHYATAKAYLQAMRAHQDGAGMTLSGVQVAEPNPITVNIKVSRSGAAHDFGLGYGDHVTAATSPNVAIDTGNIGGPSIGLICALQVYEEITGKQLRHGQQIAGTGTIDAEGKVGAIGAVDKKVAAAVKKGAKVFLVPDAPATKALLKADPGYINNATLAKRTAKALKTKMKIVPVKSLREAVDYLQTHQVN